MTGRLIPPERIETLRLVLRRAVPEDAPAIFERYAHDPEVTRYLTWRPNESVEQTQDFLRSGADVWERGEAFRWAIVPKDEPRPIGMIDLRPRDHRAEIGYVLARAFWRRGYMTEAAQELVNWALSQSRIYRVWAVCDVENTNSAKLLERIGMRREGVLRRWTVHPNISSEPRDCYSYAITK